MWGWGNEPVVLGAQRPVRNSVVFTPIDSFHSSAGLAEPGEADFKDMLHKLWFTLTARNKPENYLTTANFEHVFLGEIDKEKR